MFESVVNDRMEGSSEEDKKKETMETKDAEKEEEAALHIQRIQRGKTARLEQKMREEAAAKIQRVHRRNSVRKSSTAVTENSNPESNERDLNSTMATNFGAETRYTNFDDTADEIRGASATINNVHIDKFTTFTKNDGHFTGNFPETTDLLLNSPRNPNRLQQTQEDLVVAKGPKVHSSVKSNFKYFKWFSRKSNSVLSHKKESNFVCPVQPEPENTLVLVPKERSFRTNGIFPDPPLSNY